MPNHMRLTIVLRKDIPDQATGEALIAIVEQKLEDQPEVTVSSQIVTTYPEDE